MCLFTNYPKPNLKTNLEKNKYLHSFCQLCDFVFLVMAAYITIRNAMGHSGEIMYILLIIAATTTTMCAQVIGLSSIIVFDIYKTYTRVKNLVNSKEL